MITSGLPREGINVLRCLEHITEEENSVCGHVSLHVTGM